MAFHRDGLPVPQELQVAAEVAISNRAAIALQALEQENGDPQQSLSYLAELEAIATEANHLRCRLNIPDAKPTLEQLILRSLWHLLHDSNPATLSADVQRLERTIEVANKLNLGLSMFRAQELYFKCLHNQIVPQLSSETNSNSSHLHQLLRLGQKLAVDVSAWL
jgi:alpha-amylase/alpha-mannosidase (GH57 family)